MKKESLKSVLDKLSSRDFDGHTSFAQMTAEQKLLWLSNAAAFVYESQSQKKTKIEDKKQ